MGGIVAALDGVWFYIFESLIEDVTLGVDFFWQGKTEKIKLRLDNDKIQWLATNEQLI